VIFLDTSEVQHWRGLLDGEARAIGQRIEGAVGAQALVVAGRAIAEAPHLTGALRGSIRPLGRGLRQRVKAGNNRAFYARFQEFGTRKMAANPFLFKQANAGAHAEFEARVSRALAQGPIYQ
jgi:HK97 gp10 family phage protein